MLMRRVLQRYILYDSEDLTLIPVCAHPIRDFSLRMVRNR